jgi:predicted acylesterase/phospholipase RssA
MYTKLTKTPLLAVVKAALAMPVLYNRTVEVEGKQCMDGGLHIPFPIQEAMDNGCTDLLLLLSRPKEYVSKQPTWLSCFFFDLICSRGRPGISRTFALHHLYSRAARDLALGRSPSTPPNVNIAAICIEPSEPIQRTTVDPVALRAAAASYGRRTLRALGADATRWNLGPASALRWGDNMKCRQ